MLTKSDYLRYLQCKKYLWLHKKRKDLIGEVTEAQQVIFDQGEEVETYAHQLFKEGKTVGRDVFAAEKETKDFIDSGVEVLYQATAVSDQLLARADIFQYDSASKAWDIYEIKSPTEVQPEHIYDVCFQKVVFQKAGYKIGKTFLVHINKEYIRHGKIDPRGLLTVVDVTEEVANLESIVESDIPKALAATNEEEEPNVRIIKQCKKPHPCPFIDYCWKNIPKYSVYNLNRINEKKLTDLLDDGVMEVKNIPLNFPMTDAQLNQVTVAQTQEPLIDYAGITASIGELKYPLYFFDYETFASAVPFFDGAKPYQQICFQYSLHVRRSKGAELEHYEFLARGKENPVPDLLKQLQKDISTPDGTVLVWYKGFEMSRNTEMGEMFPEYKDFLASVNARVFDLMEVFQKQYYVHPQFKGSCSIKKVLPVLVPELSYSNLEIQEGGAAMRKYYEMNFETEDEEKREKIYENLLKYCGQDTFAMIKILGVLEQILEKRPFS